MGDDMTRAAKTEKRLSAGMQWAVLFLLFAAAAASVVYGAVFHSREVLTENEEEEIEVVEESTPWDVPFGPDVSAPSSAPEDDLVFLELSEPEMTFDVTVGGLELLDTGEIKRTYTGQPPEACPT